MPKTVAAPLARSLSDVALEIIEDHEAQGKGLYFGAVPYVEAMLRLDNLRDRFYEDGALSVVSYALSNLSYWRGETARRVKAELNAAVADARKNGVSW